MKNKTNISVKDIRGIRVTPDLVIGPQGDYASGDILDANATQELINAGGSYPPATGIPESDLSDEVKQKLNRQTQVDIVNVESGTSSITAEVGTHYNVAGGVDALDIVLPAITDTAHLQQVLFYIDAGSDPQIKFSSANGDTIEYFTDYTVVGDTSNEISCIFNGTKWIVGSNAIRPIDYSKKYLTFKALEDTTFKFTGTGAPRNRV